MLNKNEQDLFYHMWNTIFWQKECEFKPQSSVPQSQASVIIWSNFYFKCIVEGFQ